MKKFLSCLRSFFIFDLRFLFFVFTALLVFSCAAEKTNEDARAEEAAAAEDSFKSDETAALKEELHLPPEGPAPERAASYSVDALARLRSVPNGVNIAELDPANYQKINRQAMEAMGMAPYYVAFLAGEKFYREGDYDRAISEYNRSIELKADYSNAFAARGNAQRRKGDNARAIEDYTRALVLKRDYTEVYNYRGFVYSKRGDNRRAIEDYTQAIRYKADYADAYFNRAYAHAQLGNWDLCIADYTQVIKLEPSNWAAYNQRGNAWYSKGDKVKAAEDFAASAKLKAEAN